MTYNTAALRGGRNERNERQTREGRSERMMTEFEGRSIIKQSHKLKEKKRNKINVKEQRQIV